ncbi:MIZ zinc finger protein [Mycena indigotica]|uniref:MIZ zinc finger protein n=1 Tax=Mycena indigotica TaxID=2126181 RepID=A0A8H6SYB7_9AGAR|nr:MIZ zinc finger protein [Mycena indigotica]KAF7306881.1 MIZ zinc finger protein [Mycena indigotica]
MATSDPVWNDFDTVRHSISRNTVDRLKQILVGLNETCSTHLSKAGNKQAIIDRITATLDSFKVARATDKWIKARSIVQSVRFAGPSPSYLTSTSSPNVTLSALQTPTFTSANTTIKAPSFNSAGLTSSSIGRYDPYAPPRKPAVPTTPSTSTATTSKPVVRFKESPFYHVNQTISSIIECPESSSATDRRSQVFNFTLTNEQLAKLKSNSPKYQVRLFCTSSSFYSPNTTSFRATPCLVEFPPTCEVRVNSVQITANLKGLKKKPGTAPPPDLGKHIKLSTAANRVEMIYVNSQQPVVHKKFYLIVQLVEVVAVETLVQDLIQKGYKSSHEIRSEMVAAMSEDDDIVAGSQKMSLKCPLSYIRVNTPCRSRKCPHSQCFDATSWFSVMEQTTTWLCPVCERILETTDLIIDGYFDEILKSSPDSVEDVVVEADGEWHTSDNKYGSKVWKASHAPVAKQQSTPKPLLKSASKPDPNGKRKAMEIVILDSDDEDEGRVKRELSPSFASSSSGNRSFENIPRTSTSRSQPEVIDLTIDSDDESPPPPLPQPQSKRTASEAGISASPTEAIWKKGRLESIRSPPADFPRAAGVVPLVASRTLPPPPAGFTSVPSVFNINRGTIPTNSYRWS